MRFFSPTLIVILCLTSFTALSQSKPQESSCFEWSFGLSHAFYEVAQGANNRISNVAYDTITGMRMRSQTGFSGGVCKNFMLTGREIARVDAFIALFKNDVDYSLSSNDVHSFPMNAALFGGSLHYIYNIGNANRMHRGQTYMYSLVGGGVRSEMEVNDRTVKRVIPLKNEEIFGSIGLGTRCYNHKRKHLGAVELKYTLGVNNLYKGQKYDIYNGSISKVKRHTITLSFNFS